MFEYLHYVLNELQIKTDTCFPQPNSFYRVKPGGFVKENSGGEGIGLGGWIRPRVAWRLDLAHLRFFLLNGA